MKHILATSVIVSSLLVTLGDGSKILAVFPMGTKSHYNLGFRLVKELLDRGHQVTFISSFPQNKPLANLTDISTAQAKVVVTDKLKVYYEVTTWSYVEQLSFSANIGNSYTEKVLQLEEIQSLLRSNEHFDLILMENFFYEPMAIFQYKFKCPMIILTPGPSTIFTNHLFANPSQPAYVPSLLSSFETEMNFWDRMCNVYYDIVGELFVHFKNIPTQNAILQRTVPGAPDLRDILYNASFLFLLTHISIKDPSPLQPNIKEIGGYHLMPPKPLPKDLREFLDKATEGVIVFSMGSYLRSVDLPDDKKEAMLRAFSRLKQKVLWKFEKDLPGESDNVKILNWLPLQDVLGHPNVVAFITHGGLLSKIEAVYQGVPMLGLPIFWDQIKNCRESVRHGFALSIPFRQLTEENFYWALNELTSNPKYKDNAKTRSMIMRDQPVKQLDEAMFWIEYVIRYKGAPHLRSPALKLKWYQRLLLDVILVVGVIVALIFVIGFYLVKRILHSVKIKVLRKNKND